MSIIKEFKEFAVKGNVVDLAVGVIIGGAFGTIVKSVVDDIVMPPVGLVLQNVDFKNLYFPLSSAVKPGLSLEEARKLGSVIAYGNFLTILIQFIIVAFCVFLLVKVINKLKRAEAAAPVAPPEPTKSEVLLTEIRDALVKK